MHLFPYRTKNFFGYCFTIRDYVSSTLNILAVNISSGFLASNALQEFWSSDY